MGVGAWTRTVLPSIAFLALALASPAGAQTTRSGILRETIADDFAQQESTTTYGLRSGGESTPVLPTSPVSATSGDRVVVSGTMRDGTLVGSIAQAGDEPPQAALTEPRKTAVVLFKFAGEAAEPWSPAVTREFVFTGPTSANAFFQDESRGEISLAGKLNPAGDVFGWYTLDTPAGGCDYTAWRQAAQAKAEEAGVSFTGYRHVIFFFPHQSGCVWNGVASLGGTWAMINGGQPIRTVVHELGHNMGLQHAGSWICARNGVRVQISDSCSTQEYGDPFDSMGNLSARHNNAWNLQKLGVISLAANVQTVTADGTYAVRSALSSEPQVLRILRSNNPGGFVSWYYVEIRQTGGIFENVFDTSMTGVSIRATESGSSPETLILDTTPSTATFSDAPLQPGQTFKDEHVRITTVSAGGGSASVLVEFGEWLDWEAPSAPTDVSAAQSSTDVNLEWDASTDNVGVSRYVVYRNGSLVGTSPSTSFTDTGPPLGLNAYTVHAEDEAGNRSAGSAPAVVDVADRTAPSAPTSVAATQGSGGVNLHWGASTDNVGVARYVVLRDGSEIGTDPLTDFTDTGATAGPHTYTVHAEDEAGNRSAGSAPVAIDVVDPAAPGSPPEDPTPPGRKKEAPRIKPTLSWQRQPNGAIELEVDASRNPRVVRVSLWLDGRLLRSKKGRVLQLLWKPPAGRCARVYRFSARSYERTGDGKVAATVRNRSLRLPEPAAGCRT